MIHYSLLCSKGHTFDDWFASSADFDAKAKKRKITCPKCGDTKVTKAIMAPNVAKSAAAPAPAPSCGMGGCASGMCPMAQGG
jgi:hypothetical protein